MRVDDPSILDLIIRDKDLIIYYGKNSLLTPGGHEFSHPGERFMKHLITDLVSPPAPGSFNSADLFIYQKDLVETGKDPFLNNFSSVLKEDLFVNVKSGKQALHSGKIPGLPDDNSMNLGVVNFRIWALSGILDRIREFLSDHLIKLESLKEPDEPLEKLLSFIYESFIPSEKTATGYLSSIHNAGVVLPMLLVAGRITPLEYGKALHAEGKPDLNVLAEEASTALQYVIIEKTSSGPSNRFSRIISSGEGVDLEFKATLRWDLKANKMNQAVEHSVLKTISAFLNTQGGTLLIGVRDDGSIEGIASDRFHNEDKFLLHLWTLIRTCFGRDISPFVRTALEEVDGKIICGVQCNKSSRPVFLRQSGFEEEFYIRIGPSSAALNVSEALKYIRDHFPDYAP
jgi:hypothetical protein